MALLTRYFSTAAAGAGDGTSWADRAQLVSGSVWSTVITGFNFTSDSLLCLIGPGTYTPTGEFTSTLYTSTAPNASFRCYWHGCDSSGNKLSPNNPNWSSDEGDYDDTGYPLIATNTNIRTVTSGVSLLEFISFTASGTINALAITGVRANHCKFVNSSSNTSVAVHTSPGSTNCHVEASGTSYAYVYGSNSVQFGQNLRLKGNPSASSGSRRLVQIASTSVSIVSMNRCCLIGGVNSIVFDSTSVNAATVLMWTQCTIVGPIGDGIYGEDTTGASGLYIEGCYFANCGGWAIDVRSGGTVIGIMNNRFRDNTAGNINNLGSGFESDNYITDSDDATEFNDPGNGDYRLKAGLPFSDRNIGVSQMSSSSGTGSTMVGLIC